MKNLKTLSSMLFLTLLPLVALSQDSDIEELTFKKASGSCDFVSSPQYSKGDSIFTAKANSDALKVVENLLKAAGVTSKNFELRQADVKTAQAVIINDKRTILCNPTFIRKALKNDEEGWKAKAVLAHELAHHISEHGLESNGQRAKEELEADQWAGFVLAKMGASVEQAKSAVRSLAPENGSKTHPKRGSREFAVDIGWQKGRRGGVAKKTDTTPKPLPDPGTDPSPKPEVAKKPVGPPLKTLPVDNKDPFAILKDLDYWLGASAEKQDAVIGSIARALKGYKWIETKDYECGGLRCRIATFEHLRSGLLLNLIPGGTYTMGSESGDSDERPAHKVTIQPMLVGKHEVRQGCWDKVGGEDKRAWTGRDLPIEGVSWTAASDWLKKAGGGLRLLSESEWEYACRAARVQTKYPWGQSMDNSYCWYEKNSQKQTHPVTAHSGKTNAFGLVDMPGNVWEWCQDQWVDNYDKGPKDAKPRLSTISSERVARGGSWSLNEAHCRSANRISCSPTYQDSVMGFRVACSLNFGGAQGSGKLPPYARALKQKLDKRLFFQAWLMIQQIAKQKPEVYRQDKALQNLTKQIGQHFANRWAKVVNEAVQLIRNGQKDKAYNLYQKLRELGPDNKTYYCFLLGAKRQIRFLNQQQASQTFRNFVDQIEQRVKKQPGG